jgi:Protein of unknown function (DUF3987)
MAVFGTIQPGPLARYLRGAISGKDADGFIPRFQVLVYPDQHDKFVYVDRYPDTAAKNTAYKVFEDLDRLDPSELGCEIDERTGIPFLRFDDDAQEFFIQWYVELQTRLRSVDLSSVMACHLSKYPSLMPSLALIFHLTDMHGANSLDPISIESAMTAAAWCELLEAHANRIYQSAMDGDPDNAIRLAQRIKESLPNPFTIRDVQRKGWAGLSSNDDVRKAIDLLEDRGWVKVVEVPSGERGGRPSDRVWIHPSLMATC